MRGWNSRLKRNRIGSRLLEIGTSRQCKNCMRKALLKRRGVQIWMAFKSFWFRDCFSVSRRVRLVQKLKKMLICKSIHKLWESPRRCIALQILHKSNLFLKKTSSMRMNRFSPCHKKSDPNHLEIIQGLI